jgi:hypothetical protein
MAFNPPSGVADGATYGYGNIIWEYDAIFGVWNIVDGTIIGGVGAQGETGPTGPAGAGNIPLASYAVTGAAQFFNADFGVSVTGTVSLTGNVARTNRSNTFSAAGGNSFTYGISAANLYTGAIRALGGAADVSGSINFADYTKMDIISRQVTIGDEGGELTNTYIDVNNQPVQPSIHMSVNSGAGQMSMYTSGLILGYGYSSPLQVTGGIFRNPEEYASYQDLGSSNSIVINATGGTIQRFKITPSGQVTVSAGPGWDTTTTNATETIAVIVQSTNGKTGNFASTILSNNPVLFGVTGGIDMFTIMRVKTASSALLIGLPIANGLTAAGFSIS